MTNWFDLEFTKARVLVIGDVMLDRFVYGTVERISPEGPVPVLKLSSTTSMAGGAANVAHNITSLGGNAYLIGIIGDDEAGVELSDAIERDGVRHRLIKVPRPTTVKTRFVARGQQLLRTDSETSTSAIDAEDRLVEAFDDLVGDIDVVVISDYLKGALTERVLASIIASARSAGKDVIVDPKHKDWSRYAGATVLAPNQIELALATGSAVATDGEIVAAARLAADAASAPAILVTRGADGMTLVAGQETTHFKSVAREVFDVSGAGDTVVAAFALAYSATRDMPLAARMANVAAGIVVSKLGTATVTWNEVLLEHDSTVARQPLSLQRTLHRVAGWREQKLEVGFTNGCFDLLHPGHIHLLKEARGRCDRLVVGLNSDESVRRLKGPTRPVQNELSRASILQALEFVDAVVVFEEDTPLNLITALKPDVLVKGSDYRPDQVVGADLVESYGGRLVLVDLLSNHSTTSMLKAMGYE